MVRMAEIGETSTKRDQWRPARLIPVAGIRGQEEQETRATSCLLAVMGAVPEFGRAILNHVKAPGGRISSFTEIGFADVDNRRHRPDGAIIVERGGRVWQCLVEVKTGTAALEVEQVARYLELARDHGFAGVLTISNQITDRASESPVAIDGRRLRGLNLWHLSWSQILTDAVMQHRYHHVSDPDQAWILGELIMYLSDEAAGAGGFQDMGDKWVRVREAARQGTLRPNDKELPEIAERWEQFTKFLCLNLSQDLGRNVEPQRGRTETTRQRLDQIQQDLADRGVLRSSIRVPDAVGPVSIEADLRARMVTISTSIDLPREGRPLTRIKWLVRQLADAPPDVRLTIGFANVRRTTSELLVKARQRPELLTAPDDPKREPRSAQIALTRPLGSKRGRGAGSFVGETQSQTIAFYGEIVQHLQAWRAPAPRLPTEAQPTSVIVPAASVEINPMERDDGPDTTAPAIDPWTRPSEGPPTAEPEVTY